jgi:hypothetical protein
MAVRRFNFFNGILVCLSRFGNDTDSRFLLLALATTSGSSIVSFEDSAPHPARALSGPNVPHRATLAGLGTSQISCALATCTACSTSSTSISRLCCLCFLIILTVTTSIAISNAPPTPIPSPRYIDGLVLAAPDPAGPSIGPPSTLATLGCSELAKSRGVHLDVRCSNGAMLPIALALFIRSNIPS